MNRFILFALVVCASASFAAVSRIEKIEPGASQKTAPNFTWHDASGKEHSLREYRGKTVMLNFWATWCGPCRREIPDLETIHKEKAGKNFVLLGVSLDRGADALSKVTTFVEKSNMSYPVLLGNDELSDVYGSISAIPTTFIIDKQGNIVNKIVGGRDKGSFLEAIKSAGVQ